jgi:CheY-like chemotaxis protein
MLADLGSEVAVAGSGQESLELAPAFFRDQPGVIFLDVRLPDIDGRTVVTQLRQRAVPAQVVAHSASALAHERRQYLESGFDGFLAKPVTYQGLRACLASLPPLEAAVPLALCLRLAEAARTHNATALRLGLRELAALGPAHQPALDRLRRALDRYDMAAIQAALPTEWGAA